MMIEDDAADPQFVKNLVQTFGEQRILSFVLAGHGISLAQADVAGGKR